VATVEHRWCRWRSLYVHDPEGNILELVCYDERSSRRPNSAVQRTRGSRCSPSGR
jgi:catechol-2,3-dioxygenase